MSATTTPTTYADLYTDVLNRVRANTSDTMSIQLAKRYVNQGLHDLHVAHNWPWAERRATAQTHATYSTGTVAISTAARTTVTGTATLWNTAVTGMGFNNTRAGGKMTFAGGTDVYTVSAVGSDTAITLVDRYIGDSSLSGATYTYFEDEYALAADFSRLVDLRQFSEALALPVIPRQEFYRRFPRNSHLGKPQICTIIDLAPSSSVSPQPRVLFHPVPSTILNVPYRYITTNLAVSAAGVGQANLSADSDEPIIPLRYRHVLVLYAIAHWYRDRKDDSRTQLATAEYVDLVRRMSGDVMPEQDRPRLVPRRRNPFNPPRIVGSRYTTGTAWDELRA